MQYRNITISGVAGTGTTTLLKQLRAHLAPLGWSGYSGGEYMRQFVTLPPKDTRHHTAEDYSEEVDRRTDDSIRQQLQDSDNLIIESWLSGFMAQGIPHVLKVLLICTSDLDRALRLAERDNTAPAKAIKRAYKRLEANNRRWSNMYADRWDAWVVQTGKISADRPIFFWHPYLYDLVIDTAVFDPEACMEQVLERLDLEMAIALP